jgi:hypothetical protein
MDLKVLGPGLLPEKPAMPLPHPAVCLQEAVATMSHLLEIFHRPAMPLTHPAVCLQGAVATMSHHLDKMLRLLELFHRALKAPVEVEAEVRRYLHG